MGKLCQYCNKREAKIHFTEIKDGKQTEMHICEHCAHEKNLAMAFPSLLSSIVKGGPGIAPAESDAVPATCPTCGLSYSDFKSKGRLGCAGCYECFAPVLAPLLQKVHGAQRHTGHAPPRPEGSVLPRPQEVPRQAEPGPPNDQLESLRDELSRAIAAEEYERAAEIRDEIRSLKETLGES